MLILYVKGYYAARCMCGLDVFSGVNYIYYGLKGCIFLETNNLRITGRNTLNGKKVIIKKILIHNNDKQA
jgi:hypothetical protein